MKHTNTSAQKLNYAHFFEMGGIGFTGLKKFLLVLSALSLLCFSSCSDKDDEANAISVDEAAEITAASLGSSSGGALLYISTSADFSATETSLRGAVISTDTIILAQAQARDSGIIVSATAGNVGDWNYNWYYTHKLIVDGYLTPLQVNSTFNYSGGLDIPRYTSSHSGNGSFVYTNLGTGVISLSVPGSYTVDSLWTLNGTFTREATHTSKITAKVITSKTTLTFDDCKVYTDGSKKIKSGSAGITISGSVPSIGEFSYNGRIYFNGTGEGNLEINGKTYIISLTQGEIISK